MRKYLQYMFCAFATCSLGISVASLRLPFEHLDTADALDVVEAPADIPLVTLNTQPIELQTISPEKIASVINENRGFEVQSLWDRLGIVRPDTFHRFFEECKYCEADIFEYDLDEEPDQEVLLRISDTLQQVCRYLVFKRDGIHGNEWKLIGHIDDDFCKYGPPQHYLLLSNGKPWLMIDVFMGSGTGFALYGSRVFEVKNRTLSEVLVFPSKGHDRSTWEYPARVISARIINSDLVASVHKITIEFRIKYYCGDYLSWTKKHIAVFSRRKTAKEFLLDPRSSEIDQDYLERVYSLDALSDEQFVKDNLPEIKRHLATADREGKEWLRQLLNRCRRRHLRALGL